jgi:hypothetical protein
VAEGDGLENRCGVQASPWVRIPHPPRQARRLCPLYLASSRSGRRRLKPSPTAAASARYASVAGLLSWSSSTVAPGSAPGRTGSEPPPGTSRRTVLRAHQVPARRHHGPPSGAATWAGTSRAGSRSGRAWLPWPARQPPSTESGPCPPGRPSRGRGRTPGPSRAGPPRAASPRRERRAGHQRHRPPRRFPGRRRTRRRRPGRPGIGRPRRLTAARWPARPQPSPAAPRAPARPRSPGRRHDLSRCSHTPRSP